MATLGPLVYSLFSTLSFPFVVGFSILSILLSASYYRYLQEKKDGKAADLHQKWWGLRRERQKEIDASISRRADMELLYDQPYEDNKKVRVSGPFTVESLSPHRVLPSEQERPQSEKEADNQPGAAQPSSRR